MKMAKNEDLVNAVFSRTLKMEGKKKLPCAQAFQIAKEFETEIIEIGRICNRQNIKICNCQLGCFK